MGDGSPARGLTVRGLVRDLIAHPRLLQEDYHKLLTKYAEAENTIDQLRLGAKVLGPVGWRGALGRPWG